MRMKIALKKIIITKQWLKKIEISLVKKIISVALLNNYSFKNTILLNCSTTILKDQMLYFFQMMLLNKLSKKNPCTIPLGHTKEQKRNKNGIRTFRFSFLFTL